MGAQPILDLIRVMIIFIGSLIYEDGEIKNNILNIRFSGDHRLSVTILDLRDWYKLSPIATFKPL